MQRLFTASSILVLRPSYMRSLQSPGLKAFRPPIRALTSSTSITQNRQVSDKSIQSPAGMFKLERQVFVASLPLLPLAYFVHGPFMDLLLTGAIVVNCHFGAHALLTDYARPIVVGEKLAKLAHYIAYVFSVLLLGGLLHFNYNDVGLTRAFELFFSL